MRDLHGLADEAAATVLAAAAAVSQAPSHPRARAYLDWLARELGASPDAADAPDPAQLAAGLDASTREAALQRLVLAAMLVPPLTDARLDLLERYAAAIDLSKEPALVDLRRAAAGRGRALTMGLMRRFPPNERVKAALRAGSWGDRWRLFKALARLTDAGSAARYAALGELPEGTLGRGFYEHCRGHGFPFPGERGGLPEAAIFHDMGHVLLGHGVDIDGETRVGGFEAGTLGARGFVMLEFALLLFNLGAPLPTNARPEVDKIDIDVLLAAFARGRASTLELLTWDPWADVAETVASLRARYHIDAPSTS